VRKYGGEDMCVDIPFERTCTQCHRAFLCVLHRLVRSMGICPSEAKVFNKFFAYSFLGRCYSKYVCKVVIRTTLAFPYYLTWVLLFVPVSPKFL